MKALTFHRPCLASMLILALGVAWSHWLPGKMTIAMAENHAGIGGCDNPCVSEWYVDCPDEPGEDCPLIHVYLECYGESQKTEHYSGVSCDHPDCEIMTDCHCRL